MKHILNTTILLILISCSTNSNKKTTKTYSNPAIPQTSIQPSTISFESNNEGDCYSSNKKALLNDTIIIIDTLDCGDYGGSIIKTFSINNTIIKYHIISNENNFNHYLKSQSLYTLLDSTLTTKTDSIKTLNYTPIINQGIKQKISYEKAISFLKKVKNAR